MVTGTSSPEAVSTVQTVSVTLNMPARISFTVPERRGGIMILWRMALVSCTSPMMEPPSTAVPSSTVGAKVHSRSRFRAGTETPRAMVWPVRARISVRGRWMPSYMFSRSPGPSSTDRGAPVVSTTAPGPSPLVSS